ncbi:MAG: DUF4427 domain-containing protein [Polyangiaceae bacterium]|nr:DUF4427 domain-containing protein [Polyangiaceae bacterium]
MRRAFVSKSRRYLVPLPEFAASPSLHQREGMGEEMSARVLERFGVEGGYFSVLESDDPDHLPFFVMCRWRTSSSSTELEGPRARPCARQCASAVFG